MLSLMAVTTGVLAASDAVPKGLAKADWTSIRAAYEAGRHAFQPVEGGWQARNPGQQWTTKFDGRGFVAEPKGGGWQWGLELKSYGFAGSERAIDGQPAVKAAGQRLSYQWDATVQEWWVNDTRGLEHGFTLRERPHAGADEAAPLQFDLAVRGTLKPQTAPDGLGVAFRDAAGALVLNYAGLKVWDADGKVLPSHFAAAPAGVRLLVDERGARYPLTIDPIAQQAYLKPAAFGTTQVNDQFGGAVAVSGDTVVIGARLEDSSTTGVNSTPNDDGTAADAGAAYVFVRNGTTWSQQAYLKPVAIGTTQTGDQFGISVAVSGDTVVVGANGEDSSTTGVNSTPNESASSSGAAYVFGRSGTVWTQQAYLKPGAVGTTQAGDNFGTSVAVSGDTVVVGANGEDSSTTGVNSSPNDVGSANTSGAAYIFKRNGTTWSEQAYLKPAAVGTTQAADAFGRSVAVSGDTVVVGANGEDSSTLGLNSTPDESASSSGAAYVFGRSGTVWTQHVYLKPVAIGTTQTDDLFGISVAMSGDTVVVGANGEDSSTMGVNSSPDEISSGAGAAYIFAVRIPTITDIMDQSISVNTLTNSLPFIIDGAGTPLDSLTVSGTSSNQALVVDGNIFLGGSGASRTVTVVPETNQIGSTTITVMVSDGLLTGTDTFVVTVLGADIAVEQPFNSNIADGGTKSFGSVTVGANSSLNFVIKNTGNANLTGLTISQDGVDAGMFTVTANPTAPVGGPNGTTAFTVRFAPTSVGLKTAAIHIASNDPDESPFDITLTGGPPAVPEIAVERSSVNIADGGSVGFVTATVGSPADVVFTVRNTGTAPLALTGTPVVVVGGTDAALFSVISPPASALGAGDSTTFIVRYTPIDSSTKTATLSLANNDADENPFDINLTGAVLSFTADTDGDGFSDASELQMAALGYDWQVMQTALVNTYTSNANGLGYYTAAQVQALNIDVPLIQRDGLGQFKLIIGVKKSTDLILFNPFPMNQPGMTTVINGEGKLEFQFTVPDNAAFFRLQAQ